MKIAKFSFILVLVAALWAGCSSDDEAKSVTKAQLAEELCAQIAKCNAALYQTVGGDASCTQTVSSSLISEDVCPAADYDAEVAGECVDGSNALTCDQFNTSLTTQMTGTGTSYFPDACDNMCGAMM